MTDPEVIIFGSCMAIAAGVEFILWIRASNEAHYYRWLWLQERMAREREQQRQQQWPQINLGELVRHKPGGIH